MENSIQIAKWLDPEIGDLQVRSNRFTAQIATLEKQRSDLEKTVHLFEVRHTKDLGDLVLRILNLRRSIAEKRILDQPQNDEVKKEYGQAVRDEAEYKTAYDDTINSQIPELNEVEIKKLKKMRNRIARLLHDNPTMKEEYRQDANDLMVKTNKAYNNNDIHTITEIFEYVENGKPFKLSDAKTEKDTLVAEIKYKQSQVTRLEQEINDLKCSSTYQTIAQISDWDDYFITARNQFRRDLEYLEQQLK